MKSDADIDDASIEKVDEELPQAQSLASEFSFKNPVIVRTGKEEREASATILKTVSEPIPCQESEEDCA